MVLCSQYYRIYSWTATPVHGGLSSWQLDFWCVSQGLFPVTIPVGNVCLLGVLFSQACLTSFLPVYVLDGLQDHGHCVHSSSQYAKVSNWSFVVRVCLAGISRSFPAGQSPGLHRLRTHPVLRISSHTTLRPAHHARAKSWHFCSRDIPLGRTHSTWPSNVTGKNIYKLAL